LFYRSLFTDHRSLRHALAMNYNDSRPAGPVMIDIENITKEYVMGEEIVHALRGVSLQIRSNEYIAIMGPSGSGKSTLMNMLGCLDTPTSGRYEFNGRDVSVMNDDELAAIRNLDSKTGEEIMALFESLYQRGHTIILVTHEADIARHARRTVHLRDGLIESDDHAAAIPEFESVGSS